MEPSINQTSQKTNRTWVIVSLILAVLLAASLGWNIYNLNKSPLPPASPLSKSPEPSLFEHQTATINGKILTVNGNLLKIRNLQGVEGEVILSENVGIHDFTDPTASASAGINKVKTNKDAIVNLEVMDSKYVVTFINYLLPVPAVAKLPATPFAATSSATTSSNKNSPAASSEEN
jgi:hypothetical protein